MATLFRDAVFELSKLGMYAKTVDGNIIVVGFNAHHRWPMTHKVSTPDEAIEHGKRMHTAKSFVSRALGER